MPNEKPPSSSSPRSPTWKKWRDKHGRQRYRRIANPNLLTELQREDPPRDKPTVNKRATPKAARAAGETSGQFPVAKSITAFCRDMGISRASFYRNIDQMPRVVTIGHQRRILREDEQSWVERRRAAAEGRR